MRILLLLIGFWLAQMPFGFTQKTDSTTVEKVVTPKVKSIHPIPKRALLLSLVPGLGQAYNKKYWKIPIVLGGIGFSAYMIYDNKKKYNSLDRAYRFRYDNDPETIDTVYPLYSNEAIFEIRGLYDKNVQVAWIWTGVVYSLNLIDAFVDAHLSHFDVSDDLSLDIQPTLFGGQGLGFVGVCQF